MQSSSVFLVKKLAKMFLICLAIAIVAANIAISQFLPADFFSFMQEDKTTAIHFLKSLKSVPQFNMLAERQRNIYGRDIDIELFGSETQRDVKIFQLEKMLTYNPNARDVLFNLYKLYKEAGNTEKANRYLKQARAIDPMVEKAQ